jgi:predicted RNA-binding Zn ribbon-like protein
VAQGRFLLYTGELALDFANTVGGPSGRADLALDYADLVAWSVEAGTLRDSRARELLREASRRPQEADEVYAAALALQGALYRTFSAIATAREPESTDLETIRSALADALGHARLRRSDHRFSWDWLTASKGELEQLLWPVALSAAELLTSDRMNLVKECASERCTDLFLDVSRNRSRRWCDMSVCGNRAKARRYYERTERPRAGSKPGAAGRTPPARAPATPSRTAWVKAEVVRDRERARPRERDSAERAARSRTAARSSSR